jgi:hypothetical protein
VADAEDKSGAETIEGVEIIFFNKNVSLTRRKVSPDTPTRNFVLMSEKYGENCFKIIRQFANHYVTGLGDFVIVILLAGVLLIRPQGLLGKVRA